jgi:hypothetical protein
VSPISASPIASRELIDTAQAGVLTEAPLTATPVGLSFDAPPIQVTAVACCRQIASVIGCDCQRRRDRFGRWQRCT